MEAIFFSIYWYIVQRKLLLKLFTQFIKAKRGRDIISPSKKLDRFSLNHVLKSPRKPGDESKFCVLKVSNGHCSHAINSETPSLYLIK